MDQAAEEVTATEPRTRSRSQSRDCVCLFTSAICQRAISSERNSPTPRVVSLWDGARLAGRWFADHSIGGLGGPGDIVWDSYLAFGKDSRWGSDPSDVLASGSDIIDNTGGLDSTSSRSSPAAETARGAEIRSCCGG